MEPLTVNLTDEQLKKKQEQQRAKAPPPGTSRILSKANKEQKSKIKQNENLTETKKKAAEKNDLKTNKYYESKKKELDPKNDDRINNYSNSEDFQNLLDEIYDGYYDFSYTIC
jgi:hypothetical protein